MRHAQEKAHKELAHQPADASGKDASHDPTDCPLLRGDGPVGSSSVTYSLHMSKIPYPPRRISAFSLIGYLVAGSPLVTIHPCAFLLVEADGIEPTTSCLQSTRSPN